MVRPLHLQLLGLRHGRAALGVKTCSCVCVCQVQRKHICKNTSIQEQTHKRTYTLWCMFICTYAAHTHVFLSFMRMCICMCGAVLCCAVLCCAVCMHLCPTPLQSTGRNPNPSPLRANIFDSELGLRVDCGLGKDHGISGTQVDGFSKARCLKTPSPKAGPCWCVESWVWRGEPSDLGPVSCGAAFGFWV